MNIRISERNKGIFFIIMAAFFFSLMSLFVRLAGDLPLMEKALFRNSLAFIVALFLVIRSGASIHVGKKNLPALLMRSICGTLGLLCNFYAVASMNFSDANLLNKLSPFFAVLMSIFILKEKASRKEWLVVFIAFAGAVLVIKPGYSMDTIPALVGLLGGFGAGVAYTFVRKLGQNQVPGSVIVLFFSAFSTIAVLPGFFLQFQPVTALQFVFLCGIGLCAAGGQLSITAAYTHAPAKEISVFDYTQVIFAAIWGFFLFDQIPDLFSLLGYVVIIGAAIARFLLNKHK